MGGRGFACREALTAAYAKIGDGESFLVMISNPGPDSPVKLDVLNLEAIVCSRFGMLPGDDVDGVLLDPFGNPRPIPLPDGASRRAEYGFAEDDVEGDSGALRLPLVQKGPAEQHRGCRRLRPPFPSLPSSGGIRWRRWRRRKRRRISPRFCIRIIRVGRGAGFGSAGRIDITKRMMTTLPGGWKMGQFQPEHPTTTYAEFKREILGEIARCLQMPVNIITGDSSQHNYASGRLDHQAYFKAVRMRQRACARSVVERIFREWWGEYTVHAKWPKEAPAHFWFWDGTEHVDPQKEANAQAVRLASGTTNLAIEYARMGFDWETALEQRAKEIQKMRELGILPEAGEKPAPVSEEREEE